MRAFKSYPFLKLVNSYVIDAPVPSNLNYLWNFGSLENYNLLINIRDINRRTNLGNTYFDNI